MPELDNYSYLDRSNNSFFSIDDDCVRSSVIRQLEQSPSCDLLVIGDGLWGAAFAWQAAFNGLKTVLLEQDDYGERNWGGWYLADNALSWHSIWGQFFNLFSARNALNSYVINAGYLFKPCHVVVLKDKKNSPFSTASSFSVLLKQMLQYVSVPFSADWGSPQDFCCPGFLNNVGGFRGVVFPVQFLMLEMLQAAKQEGACCLNHVSCLDIKRDRVGRCVVCWKDQLTGAGGRLTAGAVVDCRYSAARKIAQLQFDRCWNGPALIIQDFQKSSRIAVFNNFMGTIVEFDDLVCPVEALTENSPEVMRLIWSLKKSFPDLKISIDGIRGIKLCSRYRVASLRSNILWKYKEGVFSLQSADHLMAQSGAYIGLCQLLKIAKLNFKPRPVVNRSLPGWSLWVESVNDFFQIGRDKAIPENILQATAARLGSRVRLFSENRNYWQVIADRYLMGEIIIAAQIHQAATVEDFLERRLLLDINCKSNRTVAEETAAVCRTIMAQYS